MFFPFFNVHWNLFVLFVESIFGFLSFEHVHVARQRIVVSLLMKLLIFEAFELLLESVLILSGGFAIEIFDERCLSFVELFSGVFGLPVKMGDIEFHDFSLFLDLLAFVFFLLKGFKSDEFGYGREFRICKFMHLWIKRHKDLSLLQNGF